LAGPCWNYEQMAMQINHQELADELWHAEKTRVPIVPLASRGTPLRVADAYKIQSINISRHLAAGAKIVGHKIGLTSPAMQQMMGVDTPDFGHLLDTMDLDASAKVSLESYIQPRVEPEIAFRLSAALPMTGCTVADVVRATEAIAPCLELIDSRILDWKIGLIDTISDNASSAAMILGEWQTTAVNYRDLSTILKIDGETVQQGSTDDVLGDPAVAVAWLANALGEQGVAIEAGHVVLSGSCTRAVDVRAGNTVSAAFAGFGEITVGFV
jgi:2-keto-4-pentenoate hydratase